MREFKHSIFYFLQILNLRENLVETRLLLSQILCRLTKPGEDVSEIEGNQISAVKIDYDEGMSPGSPEDEVSTDDTDLVEVQAAAHNTPPVRTKVGHDKLRILSDLHKRRLLSIDSARSMTDEDSFDSTL